MARTARLLQRQPGLPAELSSLVGRDLEIAAVRKRLRGGRVVTLTGPGGCGKTRLALRVAARAAGGFEDGAWLVELASLADAALVPASIAEALGVPERDAADPMAGVVRALADREVLIVLDNCEHVLGTAGQVVVLLAGQCPGVRILATSRERLDVPGELVFAVPPLRLPEDGSVRAVAASEAGSLFMTRARAASPGFALTVDSAAAVAEVCARLDGMPLAIELAAARCPALGPAQLAARLEGHPGLLSGGAARPGRHRSLEALVSWSYDLLGEAERRLLARLSVLRGAFLVGEIAGAVGRRQRRHQVDAEQPVGILQRQAGGDAGAPVAAHGQEPLVAQPGHQLGPGAGDAVDVPAGAGRLAAEGVPGQRWNHHVKRVGPPRVAAVGGSVSGPRTCSNSRNDPGQPWDMTSGTAPGWRERTCRKWMSSPSIVVVNCGIWFSRASVARQSYRLAQ